VKGWIVTGLALGAATALAAAPGAIASLDDDPGTGARWHLRLQSVVRAEFGGAASYHAAAERAVQLVRESDKLRDLERAAHWWWERLPSEGNRGYVLLGGILDPFNQEWGWVQQETPAAAAAIARFDAYYGELAASAFIGRRMIGADLERFGDELVRLADALDRDHNTEQAVETPHGTDAGEVVGGFVDDVINPPLRAVAWGAQKAGAAAVSVANGAIDGATSAVTSLVKGVGVTALIVLAGVGVTGVVLWKYGGGKDIAVTAVKAKAGAA
jgi:hypothetical protein